MGEGQAGQISYASDAGQIMFGFREWPSYDVRLRLYFIVVGVSVTDFHAMTSEISLDNFIKKIVTCVIRAISR